MGRSPILTVNKRLLLAIVIFLVATASCTYATKKDIARIEKVLEQSTQITEVERREIRTQLVFLRAQLPVERSLSDKISEFPLWAWYGIEFILVSGIFLTNARRLNRPEKFSRRERGAFSFAVDVLNKIRDRHEDPRPPPDPDPPDERPPLKLVK